MRQPVLDASQRSRLAVAAVLLGVVVGGCVLDGPKNEPRIVNASGVTVGVFWTSGVDEVHYDDIPPGHEIGVFKYIGTCAPNDMVAKTADGQELARTEKPLCPGDFWVIGPPGSPSPGQS